MPYGRDDGGHGSPGVSQAVRHSRPGSGSRSAAVADDRTTTLRNLWNHGRHGRPLSVFLGGAPSHPGKFA